MSRAGRETALFLSTLKRIGTCGLFNIPWERQNGCAHDWATALRMAVAPERRVGWHPAITWEQWSRVHA